MTKREHKVDDPVTAAARDRALHAHARARDAERRLERCRAAVAKPGGGTRPHMAREAVQRAEEVAALKATAAERDAELKRAEADRPRRDRERQRAEELAAELAERERDVEAARAALADAEAARDQKAAERDAATNGANRVQAEQSEAA